MIGIMKSYFVDMANRDGSTMLKPIHPGAQYLELFSFDINNDSAPELFLAGVTVAQWVSYYYENSGGRQSANLTWPIDQKMLARTGYGVALGDDIDGNGLADLPVTGYIKGVVMPFA